jgi:ribosome-associated protein
VQEKPGLEIMGKWQRTKLRFYLVHDRYSLTTMVFHSNFDGSLRSSQDDATEPQSKTRRKREMQDLQDLGAQLLALTPKQLEKIPVSGELLAAIAEARRFTRKNEALRRQMQYIGKLMRCVDPEPIRARLAALRDRSASEIARQRRLERLREELLADEKTVDNIAREWPEADIQRLRALRRNALKEREQKRPLRAYREIFRILRGLEFNRQEEIDAHPAPEAEGD